jgi:phosphate acetyltransferase
VTTRTSIYVASPEGSTDTSVVAVGLIEALTRTGVSVGVFRPAVHGGSEDAIPQALVRQAGGGETYADGVGVTYADVHRDLGAALHTLVEKNALLAEKVEAVVVLGTDYTGTTSPIELTFNARVAANLNASVVLVVSGRERTPAEVREIAETGLAEFAAHHALVVAVVAVSISPVDQAAVQAELAKLPDVLTLAVPAESMPEREDVAALLDAVETHRSDVVTPLMFEHQLQELARSDRRTIVLPESADDRILISADIVAQRGLADLVLLGDAHAIAERASQLELALQDVRVVDPSDPKLVERFAEEYARLRAHKGMTVEGAREKLKDLSYFGTMMVHLGLADGMVSGAVNTTANTIRPSLEFIKTKPGVTVVSGAFLMCLADRVVVYGDCAVNPNPTPEQLADIAISSAETAVAFGMEPRVAMLSYSTGTSGSGADVDKVRAATEIVRQRTPELAVEGPIQFDAAVDPVVARTKLPESAVAGRATVFIFPDLNTGNNTYKAVQRTSGAVAIGPVLQGLNKPVNDLSRGALVEDIVNTVAMTAVQAQAERKAAK